MSGLQGSAEFSDDGRFRHRLDRWWAEGARALVCMANPSKAGADENDPTIHALIALVRPLGYPGLTVVNASDYIATSPDDHRRWLVNLDLSARRSHDDRVRASVAALTSGAAVRFVAWGNLVEPSLSIIRLTDALSEDGKHDLMAFGMTRTGAPKHPLARGKERIVPGTPPIIWKRKAPHTQEGKR